MGHSRPPYPHLCLFNTFLRYLQLIVNKFTDDWIRTTDLCCWKQPLYQLGYNFCSSNEIFAQCPVNNIIKQGGHLVMGGDSCPIVGCLESQHRIPDGSCLNLKCYKTEMWMYIWCEITYGHLTDKVRQFDILIKLSLVLHITSY